MNQVANRSYELMDVLPEPYTVRKNHPYSLVVSAESLLEFLSGWCEGAPHLSNGKGQPRLHMRHAPYTVGPVERHEWTPSMRLTLAEQVEDAGLSDALIETFQKLADHMINTDGSPTCVSPNHS